MPDLPRVPHPVFSPTCCMLCTTSGHQLGFLDSGIELHGYGNVYICAGCAIQAGTRFGMLDTKAAAELEATLADARLRIRELEQEVSRARGAGQWTWVPAEPQNGGVPQPEGDWSRAVALDVTADPLVCECGRSKGASSKRCRSCSARIASEARKAGAAA